MQLTPPARRTAARIWGMGTFIASFLPLPAWAADAHGPVPGPAWAIPFAGVLLSIAVFPIVAPHVWHRRMGVVVAGWTLALLLLRYW